VRVLLSFISVERSNPIVPLVIQLTEPLLRPIRRRVPAMGGLDFSPAIVMLAIALMRVLLVAPLSDIGKQLAQAAM
jgi:YggT family protein